MANRLLIQTWFTWLLKKAYKLHHYKPFFFQVCNWRVINIKLDHLWFIIQMSLSYRASQVLERVAAPPAGFLCRLRFYKVEVWVWSPLMLKSLVVKRGNEVLNATFFISSATHPAAKRGSNFFHYYSYRLIRPATLDLMTSQWHCSPLLIVGDKTMRGFNLSHSM